jgi:molecular chaperone DnaJ
VARDFYDVLGISRKSSDEEIKKAYRRLARRHHPDRNPDDPKAEERFKEIQEAYDTLSDPEKRRTYDSGGMFAGFGGRGFGGEGGPGFASDLGEVFSTFFRGRGPEAGPTDNRGRDLETEVQLTFEQAVEGANVTVAVPKAAPCKNCGGTGAATGTQPRVCPSCGGRGVDAQSQGLFSITQPCAECGGQGTVIDDPCRVCNGTGLTEQTRRYRVKVPPGVHDGSRIRLAGRGEAGPRGGPPGDLYVVTRVTSSPVFEQRANGDLEVAVPITVPEAIAGSTIEVPTLRGTKRIRIPAGTKPGSVQRLRGEGAPRPGGRGRGDIHYRLAIDIPRNLTRAQRRAVEELAESLNSHNPREKLLRDAARTTTARQTADEATGEAGGDT